MILHFRSRIAPIILALLPSVVVFLSVHDAVAQFTPEINYQGKLLDDTGATVANGLYHMRFRLYDQATGGSLVWSEDRSAAPGNRAQVTSGLFSVMLGSSTSLTSVDFDQPLYLEVSIGGMASSTWETLSPRKRLGAVPVAFYADDAGSLGGVASSSFLRSDDADIMAVNAAETALTITQSGAGGLIDLVGSLATTSVDSRGYLGVGTTSPWAKLSVQYTDGTDTGPRFVVGSSTAPNLFVGADGNVGIGTSSPGYVLDVATQARIAGGNGLVGAINSSTYALSLQNNTSSVWLEMLNNGGAGRGAFFGLSGNNFEQYNWQGGDIIFYTNPSVSSGTERLRITNTGNVGIGTNSPDALLDLGAGDLRLTNGYSIAWGDWSTLISGDSSDGADGITLFSGGQSRMYINGVTGNVGIGTTSPLARLSVKGGGTTTGLLAQFTDSADTPRVTVLDNGNVGIGTTTPSMLLDIFKSQNAAVTARIVNSNAGANAAAEFGLDNGSKYGVFGLGGTGYAGYGSIDSSNAYILSDGGIALAADTASGVIKFGTGVGVSERMRINATGNVGIGTISPEAVLDIRGQAIQHVSDGTWGAFESFAYGSNYWDAPFFVARRGRGSKESPTYPQTGDWLGVLSFRNYDPAVIKGSSIIGVATENHVSDSAGSALYFATTPNGSTSEIERMRVDENGNVGIGTTSPQTKLQVDGVISPALDNTYTLGNSTYRFSEVYAANGVINTSDIRLKHDPQTLTYGLDTILALEPIHYTWKDQPDQGTRFGLSAQHVHDLIPEIVAEGTDENKTLGIRYTELIPIIINAIQELADQVATMAEGTFDTLFAKKVVVDVVEADRVTAREDVRAGGNVRADKAICIEDLCITRDDLAAILESQAGQASTPTPTPMAPTPEPTPAEATETDDAVGPDEAELEEEDEPEEQPSPDDEAAEEQPVTDPEAEPTEA